MRKTVVFVIFLYLLFNFIYETSYSQALKVIRGPYLNMVTPSSITIRWRTNEATDSKISFGLQLESLEMLALDTMKVIDHELLISGLAPDTKYYYVVQLEGETKKGFADQYFETAPEVGSNKPIRIWALGDFGNSSVNQLNCLNAISKETASYKPDVWIWLGDNAYQNGKDRQYQKHVFKIYQKSFLKNTPVYPSPGNHDYARKPEKKNIAYFKIFTMPTKGEAGGVPSGSESYYAVDYGNVHLISLDSYGVLDDGYTLYDTLSKQVTWLKKDLAANKLPWTIVFMHHPPYTHGSHLSDKEELLIKLRENLMPILERYNVDLVLSGHSHVYERFHPMLAHYGLTNTFDSTKHIVAQTDSLKNYYVKEDRMGVIYIVNGSGGKIGGADLRSPFKSVAYYNNTVGGSMLLDFSGNRLEARWVCADGIIRDKFSIVKELNTNPQNESQEQRE